MGMPARTCRLLSTPRDLEGIAPTDVKIYQVIITSSGGMSYISHRQSMRPLLATLLPLLMGLAHMLRIGDDNFMSWFIKKVGGD